MRQIEWALVGLLCATAALGESAPERIPAAHGTTLSGEPVALPAALKGEVGVLVIGFSHASQGQVAGWGHRLAADYGSSSSVQYFEMPILAGAPRMLRGMIIKKMGSSVPAGEKPHFLPLTEDESGWRNVAHYSQADEAYVLVTDSDGAVKWQTHGTVSDTSYGDLKRHVDELLRH